MKRRQYYGPLLQTANQKPITALRAFPQVRKIDNRLRVLSVTLNDVYCSYLIIETNFNGPIALVRKLVVERIFCTRTVETQINFTLSIYENKFVPISWLGFSSLLSLSLFDKYRCNLKKLSLFLCEDFTRCIDIVLIFLHTLVLQEYLILTESRIPLKPMLGA